MWNFYVTKMIQNYKNRLSLAKVIVKNIMSRFLWFTVYNPLNVHKAIRFIVTISAVDDNNGKLYRPTSRCNIPFARAFTLQHVLLVATCLGYELTSLIVTMSIQ